MRKTLTFLVAAAFAVFAAGSALAGVETLDEAQALAAEQGKPLLIDFYTTW